ncbi:MAG: amidohydrolase, partial [Dehalococcoidia bacterium]
MAQKERIAFLGGTVFTSNDRDRTASGVYVEDGIIRAVGAREEVKKALPSDTTIIDIEGKTLVPGFIDAHNHLPFQGAA